MKKKFKEKHKKDFLLLYLGFCMFIIFLFLWFVTLPEVEIIEDPVERSFDELSATEQLEYVEEKEQETQDDAYYRYAIRTNNSAYCERIEDLNLRSACLEEVTNHEEIVVDTRSSSEVMADSNYALARRLGDSSYCEKIEDESIKEACVNHFE